MNILKLKDVVIELGSVDSLNEEQVSMFNEYFKGKYVHCINWTYCIPLDELNNDQVKTISQTLCKAIDSEDITDDNGYNNPWSVYGEEDLDDIESNILDPDSSIYKLLQGKHILKLYEVSDFIDEVETDRINSTDRLASFNEYTVSGLTAEQIKKFRTWLATTILSFGYEYEDTTTHMLKYYANGMYDDVIKALVAFGNVNGLNISMNVGASTCGCAGNATAAATLASLQGGLSLCDPLAIYRHNIYLKMIEVFSAIDFWTEFDPEFLQEFKLYIDSIIKMNLPLSTVQWQSDFVDCSCKIGTNTAQELGLSRLNRLSTALGYMIDDKISGHRTYIVNAFSDWATYLYEIMEW